MQMYKRHDPSIVEEIEFMENLFNSLCSALMLPANRDRFLKGEGIQLMNLMLRLAFVFSARLILLKSGPVHYTVTIIQDEMLFCQTIKKTRKKVQKKYYSFNSI